MTKCNQVSQSLNAKINSEGRALVRKIQQSSQEDNVVVRVSKMQSI